MNPFTIAAIVLACVFGGALAGQFLGNRLPRHHLQEDSKDIVKLGIGVVATMAALVLGLLVSSAKSSFDKMSDELTLEAARVVQLDRSLIMALKRKRFAARSDTISRQWSTRWLARTNPRMRNRAA